MRLFFFDDIRKAPSTEWVVARDVPEAKKILSEQVFDVWALDHDIGMQILCKECNPVQYVAWLGNMDDNFTSFKETEARFQDGCVHYETGTVLVKWMLENIKEWPKLIVIHSANPWGAERMAALLATKTDTPVQIIPYHKVLWNTIRWEH